MTTPISYITCTRNRPSELADTIGRLDALHRHDPQSVEVVIADNASDTPIRQCLPPTTIPVRVVTLQANIAAAARNHAAAHTRHDWLVMLDDDSAPRDLGHLNVLAQTPPTTAAVMADITLPDGSRERGGLPEVFIGCGAAIRKQAFIDAGGYDPDFFYFAEEPDLCARLIAAGWDIRFSPWFRVLHKKTSTNRDHNRMLRLLTRNQGVVIERTTPDQDRNFLRKDHVRRCAWIARKEGALQGFAQGLAELRSTRHTLKRQPLGHHHYERFTGLHHARQAIEQALQLQPFDTACLTHEGKHAWAVRRALTEAGIHLTEDAYAADRLVIATLSPGPMLDALAHLHATGQGHRTIAPWTQALNILGLESEPFPLMPSLLAQPAHRESQAEAPAQTRIRA
ncbi:MAG: glycosyltransferase [Phycisphaeraceae bacterium]|nr:glycosyltransferase [Phycisphaeraceae bacterium]